MRNWKLWLKAAGIRAVKTVAQTAVGTIGSGAIFSAVDWRMVVSASLMAGVVSLLTSIAGLPEGPENEKGIRYYLRRCSAQGHLALRHAKR